MQPMHVRLKLTVAGVVLASAAVSAQQGVRATTEAIKTPKPSVNAAAHKAARDIKSLINGVAVDSNERPLPNTTVRLRNLKLNSIEQTVTANERGEFTFAVQPNVPYVIEIVDQASRVVAVGDVITVNTGEVAGAIVALPSRLPAIAGLFGDTVGSVISAAAGTGLTVVDPALPKVSPSQ